MPSKNITLNLHQTLAHEIKAAKKLMFKRHREGLPIRHAADQFVIDVTNRFKRLSLSISAKQDGSAAPSFSSDSAGPLSVEERDRVEREVVSLLKFIDAPAPDFIMAAIVDAIDTACEHFEIPKPEYEIGEEGQKRTRLALIRLFSKTRLFKLDDIENPVGDLAWAISTIIKSPVTPARLRQQVADFKTDITSPTDSPEEIENALQAGQCGYAACPGSDDPLKPCPGPDGSGAHVGKHDKPDDDDDDHVTVTLPNGKQVDLYGDAAEIAKEPPDAETSDGHGERLDVGKLVDIAMDGDRDQEKRGAALFTLLSEIEQLTSERDRVALGNAMVWAAKREAFKYLGDEEMNAAFQLFRREFLADGDFVR